MLRDRWRRTWSALESPNLSKRVPGNDAEWRTRASDSMLPQAGVCRQCLDESGADGLHVHRRGGEFSTVDFVSMITPAFVVVHSTGLSTHASAQGPIDDLASASANHHPSRARVQRDTPFKWAIEGSIPPGRWGITPSEARRPHTDSVQARPQGHAPHRRSSDQG